MHITSHQELTNQSTGEEGTAARCSLKIPDCFSPGRTGSLPRKQSTEPCQLSHLTVQWHSNCTSAPLLLSFQDFDNACTPTPSHKQTITCGETQLGDKVVLFANCGFLFSVEVKSGGASGCWIAHLFCSDSDSHKKRGALGDNLNDPSLWHCCFLWDCSSWIFSPGLSAQPRGADLSLKSARGRWRRGTQIVTGRFEKGMALHSDLVWPLPEGLDQGVMASQREPGFWRKFDLYSRKRRLISRDLWTYQSNRRQTKRQLIGIKMT